MSTARSIGHTWSYGHNHDRMGHYYAGLSTEGGGGHARGSFGRRRGRPGSLRNPQHSQSGPSRGRTSVENRRAKCKPDLLRRMLLVRTLNRSPGGRRGRWSCIAPGMLRMYPRHSAWGPIALSLQKKGAGYRSEPGMKWVGASARRQGGRAPEPGPRLDLGVRPRGRAVLHLRVVRTAWPRRGPPAHFPRGPAPFLGADP